MKKIIFREENMAKMGKKIYSDWSIGTHVVNSYKTRVNDPAVRRGRRSSNDIRKVLARELNKVKDDGKDVDIQS
jgi:hypothetical protein